jgi:hypothetical protein
MLDEMHSTSTSDVCERRKMKRTEATDGVIVCLVRETYIAVSATDLEVSDLIVAVDVVLDEVAVRSQMPTKRTDAKLSPSESATIESPPWPKASWDQTAAACRRHLAVSENENVSVTGNEIETTTDPLDRAAMTTVTMTVNEGTAKTSARDRIVVVPTADPMMSSTMEMRDPLDPDDVVPMTKKTVLAVTHATPRYEE